MITKGGVKVFYDGSEEYKNYNRDFIYNLYTDPKELESGCIRHYLPIALTDSEDEYDQEHECDDDYVSSYKYDLLFVDVYTNGEVWYYNYGNKSLIGTNGIEHHCSSSRFKVNKSLNDIDDE